MWVAMNQIAKEVKKYKRMSLKIFFGVNKLRLSSWPTGRRM